MAIITNSKYHIISRSAEQSLNIWNGDLSADSNVILYPSDTEDKDQHWKVILSGGYYQLETVHNSNYVLDAYLPKNTGANADMWKKGDDGAQNLIFEHVTRNYYRIKLAKYNIYLTAIGKGPGSKTGYTSTSSGNAYYLPYKEDISQHWEFVPVGQSGSMNNPTTSNISGLGVGNTYQLNSVSAPSKNANVWNGDTSKDSNVVLWGALDTDDDQKWTIKTASDGGYYLEFAKNPNYVLDAYLPNATGANADVWTKDDLPAQSLLINKVGVNEYTISLKHFNHLYLTAYGDTNGSKTGYGAVDGNIRWTPLSSNSNLQKWKFNPTTPSSSNNPDLQEFDIINKGDKKFAFRLKSNPNLYISAKENINNGEITLQPENSSYQQTWSFFDYARKINGSSSGGSSSGGSSSGGSGNGNYPISTTPSTKTGIVKINGARSGESQWSFHAASDLKSGNFYKDNNGTVIMGELRKFFKHVYRQDPESDSKLNRNLFADWTTDLGFHQGVDINYKSGTSGISIYSAHNGVIQYLNQKDYGQICILGDDGFYYIYAHMEINSHWKTLYENEGAGKIRVTSSSNDRLGYQAGYNSAGESWGFDHHLHFEVRKDGTRMNAYNKDITGATKMTSINPYGHLNKYI